MFPPSGEPPLTFGASQAYQTHDSLARPRKFELPTTWFEVVAENLAQLENQHVRWPDPTSLNSSPRLLWLRGSPTPVCHCGVDPAVGYDAPVRVRRNLLGTYENVGRNPLLSVLNLPRAMK